MILFKGLYRIIFKRTLYYQALVKCSERYKAMYPYENTDLGKFILEFDFGIKDKLPLMKLNRWLGYIQSELIKLGFTTVEIERNWTRPLFRPLDFPFTTK